MNYYIDRKTKLVTQCDDMFGFNGAFIKKKDNKYKLMIANTANDFDWAAFPKYNFSNLEEALQALVLEHHFRL